jgi:preprotein translocase subunit SecF
MNPSRVDFFVDLAYGVLILLSVGLILVLGTNVGVAFGIGALISYVVHVVWKMARFDPEWMTEEVTEKVEETITEEMTEEVTEEVTESVEKTVTEEVAEEVTEKVEQTVTEEVTENVERTLSEEVDDIIAQLEQVNDRVDRRPRTDQIDAMTTDDEETDATTEER